jgi:hypothetical protein
MFGAEVELLLDQQSLSYFATSATFVASQTQKQIDSAFAAHRGQMNLTGAAINSYLLLCYSQMQAV